jgi:hypothetical protein
MNNQDWEKEWWGNCANTLREEEKQLEYAKRILLNVYFNANEQYEIDCEGKSILDIGGGPISMLLKCKNVKGTVIDPCNYPSWIAIRYDLAGIKYIKDKGENITEGLYDEVWIYNVLQHVEDPAKICENALRVGKVVRVFEWINMGVSPGHPHNLTEDKLNGWLKGYGKIEKMTGQNGCKGQCYYGIFKGDKFES